MNRTVGFLGLGNMGMPMATRLANAGFEVIAYNRTPEKSAKLAQLERVFIESSPAEVARKSDFLVTMVSDDIALESMLFAEGGAFSDLKKGSIHISMSTIGFALAQELTVRHAREQIGFVGAPVFGRPPAAHEGKLFILAGGKDDVIASCKPLFDVLGQKTIHVGNDASHAHLTKILGNFMLLSAIETLSESIAAARKCGLNETAFLEAMTSTIFNAPIYKNYGTMIVEQNYNQSNGFVLPLALKDIRLALQASDRQMVALPFANIIHDHLVSAIARGNEKLDMSALGKFASDNAGLK